MSQYSGQLQQEMDSSENTFQVLEPHAQDYSGYNPSTVVANGALPLSVPQEHALCLHSVPLLSHQATTCVLLDLVHHLQSVAHLSLRATDGDQDQNMQTTEMIPSQEFETNFFKKAKTLDLKVDFVIVQARFMEEKVDPVIIAKQELEEG